MSLTDRLQKARLTLLMDFPFFGQLALRLEPVIDYSIDTACTDGRRILFNPDFCAALTDPELAWLYAHEVSHPALGHLWRIGSRNPEKVNIAADYVVNEMLESVVAGQSGASVRLKPCKGALLDSRYFGMSMEDIYQLLPDPPPGGSDGNQPSPIGTFTKPQSGPGNPSAEKGDGKVDGDGETAPSSLSTLNPQPSTLQQEWQAAAAQAATVCRSRAQGALPGAIAELLRELFEPAIPWQEILRQFVSRICRDDYTFRRPNRRFAHQGIMLPTLRSEGLGTIVVAVDTSGSINTRLLTTFLSEMQGILETTAPEVIHLLDCDTRINSHREFRPGDILAGTTFSGRGGTRFAPVFDWVAQHDIQADCLLYFTDLCGPFPDREPPYPTLWLCYGNPGAKAPFGQTIHLPEP